MEIKINDQLIYRESSRFVDFSGCLINDNNTTVTLKFDDDFALENGFDSHDYSFSIQPNDWLGLDDDENSLVQNALLQDKMSVCFA